LFGLEPDALAGTRYADLVILAIPFGLRLRYFRNQMTDAQLYFAVGIPTIALVLGMIGNGFLFNALSARMNSLEARMLALETSMNTRFDLIMGRLSDMDNRLSVLEDRSQRS
jgi:hypothetical protein